MMGRQSRQTAMIFVDIESLIPETHLLRKIERMVSFDFIYDLLAPYYPATGRPSVDPVSMFKMLLIGYLYGIKSERRLVEEVQLNIRYNHRFPNRAEATVELIRLGLEEVARREREGEEIRYWKCFMKKERSTTAVLRASRTSEPRSP